MTLIPAIRCPQMIMIGAASRNVGKTEFACRLIKAQTKHKPIAVKITTLHDIPGNDAPQTAHFYPHGPAMATSTPNSSFSLTCETDPSLDKDTSRMLRAGADAVFWLQAQEDSLERGILALLKKLPTDQPIICESNSARAYINPSVFLIIHQPNQTQIKPGAAQHWHLADRIIEFHQNQWNVNPEACLFTHSHWQIPFAASAVILAGGKSRRMGQDKSLLDIGGHPLIAHIADQLKPAFDHLFISSNSTERFAFLNLPIIVDQQPDQGPLQGIASALEASPTDLLFVTGCDIPAMNLAFIRTLWQHTADCDCVVPMSPHPDGHVRYEPLFAFYRKNLVTDACAILKQGGRRIVELFKGHPTAHPLIPEGWYANLNTPEEYQGFIQQETRS